MTGEKEESESSTKEVEMKKVPKRGIIYLSTIPPYMNVTLIKETFSKFGTVGRLFLQLADTESKDGKHKTSKKRTGRKFTEGWVEFERKSVARKVATFLNNTQVSNRKRSKQYDHMWNIKYLPNFKWTHLHERLAYEKAAKRQKVRAEIQLAKKKSTFFTLNLDKKHKSLNKEYEKMEHNVQVESEDTENLNDRKEFLETLFQ